MPVVIGAGITEQWYLAHLKKLKELQIQIRPRFFGDEHMHALADRQQRRKRVVMVRRGDEHGVQAIAHLREAKRHHDALEAACRPAVDFTRLDEQIEVILTTLEG